MLRKLRALPLIVLLGILSLGCEPLSEQDKADKKEAVEALAEIGKKLPVLKAKLEKLIERGKSIAVEVAEIRAKVAAGTFPAADALDLVAGLMAEKDTITKEILSVKSDIQSLLALGKKADETLEELRKRNAWAWARTIGEGALALILAYFGVQSKRRATALVNVEGSRAAARSECTIAEKTRDVLISTIEKHPEAKATAREKAEERGVLAALGEAVERLT